ncbi:long-chain-fatty-acid--CoA ligase FadD2 [soil metagenome]
MTRRSVARRPVVHTVRDLAANAPLARALPALLRHGATFSGVIAAGARRHGDKVAIIDRWGQLDYRTLDVLVASAAGQFARGERVGVMCRDGRWLLAAAAGAIRAGADAVLIGHGTGEVELAGVVERLGIGRVVTDGDEGLRVGGLDGARPATRGGLDGARPTTRGRLDGARPAGVGTGRLVLLTSGTTGKPVAPERAPLNPLTVASLLAATGIRPGEPVLVLPPLHHGHGFSLATACLIVGAPVMVGAGLPLDEVMPLAARATVISGVPTQLDRLARHPDAASLHPRRVVSGSGRLSPSLAQRLRDQYGPVVVDLFGTTGTGTVTLATAEDLSAAPWTVGRPAAGVRIRVLDSAGRACPRGAVGAVHAGSRATGDLGWMDEHDRLFLAGRSDGLVVSGGENVSATEVEDYLAEQPEVTDVHVRAVADEEFGTRLVARVVTSADAAELTARVTRALGRHKTPRLQVVDRIERTPTGKVRLVE